MFISLRSIIAVVYGFLSYGLYFKHLTPLKLGVFLTRILSLLALEESENFNWQIQKISKLHNLLCFGLDLWYVSGKPAIAVSPLSSRAAKPSMQSNGGLSCIWWLPGGVTVLWQKSYLTMLSSCGMLAYPRNNCDSLTKMISFLESKKEDSSEFMH